jgi:DNA-binding MarR family transcriptional regulator
MLRLTSKKTLPIIHFILEKGIFSQTEIRDNTHISIGRINKICKYLIEKGIIIRENAKYHLIQPNRLTDIIANSSDIRKYVTYSLNIDKEELVQLIREKGILCMDSALECHSDTFNSQIVHVYEDPELIKLLNNIERGRTQVIMYKNPLIKDQKGVTDRIQTVIDLLTVGKQELAQILSQSIWETRQ